jgi:hypothetical protein
LSSSAAAAPTPPNLHPASFHPSTPGTHRCRSPPPPAPAVLVLDWIRVDCVGLGPVLSLVTNHNLLGWIRLTCYQQSNSFSHAFLCISRLRLRTSPARHTPSPTQSRGRQWRGSDGESAQSCRDGAGAASGASLLLQFRLSSRWQSIYFYLEILCSF